MPRPNLARAQGIVRAFCLDNNLGYHEDSLIGSYRQTIRSLRGTVVASVGRMPASVAA